MECHAPRHVSNSRSIVDWHLTAHGHYTQLDFSHHYPTSKLKKTVETDKAYCPRVAQGFLVSTSDVLVVSCGSLTMGPGMRGDVNSIRVHSSQVAHRNTSQTEMQNGNHPFAQPE